MAVRTGCERRSVVLRRQYHTTEGRSGPGVNHLHEAKLPEEGNQRALVQPTESNLPAIVEHDQEWNTEIDVWRKL